MSELKLSVVICTYNRDKWIKQAVSSTAKQSLNSSMYEVIVVNNNSTDNTESIVSAFIVEQDNLNIRQVIEKQQGLAFARNRGIEEAKGELILYMDDDGMAAFDLFEKIVNYMEANPYVIGLGGKVTPVYEGKEPKWLNPYLIMMVTKIDYGDKDIQCTGKKYPAGCNMTYRKWALEKVGGFNEQLMWRVDDKYIYLEVQKISKNIRYNPELKMGHNIDEDRTSDANFNNLSLKLGHDERKRVKSSSNFEYIAKISEYTIKFGASIILGLSYLIKNEWIKGKYIIRFRWYALLGLLNMKNFSY